MQYRNSTYPQDVWDIYYYEKNLQGDIMAVYNSTGAKLVSYNYDAWGDISYVSYSNGGANTSARYNPLLYRGYYYDDDLDFYYLATRYYDPEVCRFITVDDFAVLAATPMGLTDKNLYAYCDNNPVVRRDNGGTFWESAIDVISFGASIVEVCVNPTDIWAWAGLVGDTIDLIPFMTGAGELTRAVKTTVKVVDKATDVLDTANDL